MNNFNVHILLSILCLPTSHSLTNVIYSYSICLTYASYPILDPKIFLDFERWKKKFQKFHPTFQIGFCV